MDKISWQETGIAGDADTCYESRLKCQRPARHSEPKPQLAAGPKKGHIMADEASNRFAGETDSGGYSQGSRGEPASLQSRAYFLKNWSWTSVTQIHDGLCERGRAQRGLNPETHAAVEEEWEHHRASELRLLETFQFLKSCHRRAPFLFFNGNTFAEIGRALATALFADLKFQRRKEASSAVAHFITGVLDEEMMLAAIESLCQSTNFVVGDHVQTLRGSTHGVIQRILDDGRVVWKPEGTQSELTALPESLLREKKSP
jgi:hypothetical protein